MDTIGSRIKRLRKSKKMSQVELGNLIDVSGVSIGYWERGFNEPLYENLIALAQVLDTTIPYLKDGIEDAEPSVQDLRPITRMLPVLSYVQAGTWTNVKTIHEYDIEKWLPAPPNAGKNSYYMIIQGVSNSPHFNHGDHICIDPDISLESVQTGEMVVAECTDGATFKALVRDHNKIYLQALNPNFQPNILELNESCIYKGKYVGKFEPPKKFI